MRKAWALLLPLVACLGVSCQARGGQNPRAVSPTDRPVADAGSNGIARARAQVVRYVGGKIGRVWLEVRGRGTPIEFGVALPPNKDLRFVPFFWPQTDRIRSTGRGFRFRLDDDGVPGVAALLGGDEQTAASPRVIANDSGLSVRKEKPAEEEASIRYWYEQDPIPMGEHTEIKNEMFFRLRALGYIN